MTATTDQSEFPGVRRGRSLTAAAIDAQRFAVVRRGYAMQQVDDLLDRLSAKIHRTERELADVRLQRQMAVDQLREAHARISTLETEVAHAHQEVSQEQQHTEQTRQMFDRDLRDRAATIHELQRSLRAAEVQAAEERSALTARADHAESRLAATADQLASVTADHDRVVAELRAELDGVIKERNEATEALAEQQRLVRQREEEFATLSRQAASLVDTMRQLHATVSSRRDEDSDWLSTVDTRLAALDDGPLAPIPLDPTVNDQ